MPGEGEKGSLVAAAPSRAFSENRKVLQNSGKRSYEQRLREIHRVHRSCGSQPHVLASPQGRGLAGEALLRAAPTKSRWFLRSCGSQPHVLREP